METTKPELFYRDGRPFSGLTPADYDERKGSASFYRAGTCHRCGGAGGSQAWAYTWYTCYQCGGSGKGAHVLTKIYTAERLAKLNATKARADERKAAKRAAEAAAAEAERVANLAARRAEFDAAYPGLSGLIDMYAEGSEFLTSMAGNLAHTGTLTERQAQAAQDAVQRARAGQIRQSRAHHVGTVGERLELTIKCERIITLDDGARFDSFGPRYLYACITPEGAPSSI